MSEYFSYFPQITHDLQDEGRNQQLTNILRRFVIKSKIKDRADVYYEYDLRSGDRPDTIAEKYYGDSDLAWVVLLYNEINDPFFGWALFDQDFEEYIRGKYGSIPEAQGEVHEYRQVLNEAEVKFDGTRVPKRYVVVDETTYNSLGQGVKESISKYDYEVEENEKRRKIKILDKRYIEQIRDEVKDILRDDT